MHLNGNVDKELIGRCLNQVENFFEIGVAERKAANELIYQVYLEIANAHQAIFSHADSMTELLVEHFLKPLKNIIPDEFGLAAMLTVYVKGALVYEFKVISRDEMDQFIPVHLLDLDSRVSLIGDWLFIIRMDKVRKSVKLLK